MQGSIRIRPDHESATPCRRSRLASSVSRWALAGALGALVAATAPAIAAAQGVDITLTAGDDVHVITDSDLPNGTIDAGDGWDWLIANIDDFSAVLDMSRLLNFEMFTASGPGVLTLGGDGSGQNWEIEGGTLMIDVGASVGDIFGCCTAAGTSIVNDGTVVSGGSIMLSAISEGSVLNFGTIENGTLMVDGALAFASNKGSIHFESFAGAVMGVSGDGASLSNSGTITGIGEHLTGMAGSGADISLVNEGTVTVQGLYSTGAHLFGDGWRFTNTGTITGDAYGVRIEGDGGTAINNGEILALSRSDAVVGLDVVGDNNLIINTNGIAAGSGPYDADGPIEGAPFDAFFPIGLSVEGDNNEIINRGDIYALGRGASAVTITGADNSFVNYSDVGSLGEESIGINIVTTVSFGPDGSSFPDTVATVENHGRVGGEAAAVRFGSVATQSHTLINHEGALITSTGVGVMGGDGDETFHNYGLLYGEAALSLGGGNDTVYFYGGSLYEGALEGGDGYDEFFVAGSGSLTLNLADLSGFELHQLVGPTLLTLTGQDATSDWFISGGQITVAEGALLRSISQPFEADPDEPAAAVGIVNDGTLESVSVEGADSVIINNGAIINTDFGGYGISAVTETGDGVQIVNNGSILAFSTRGSGVGLAGNGHQFQNAGSIIAADPEYGVGVAIAGNDAMATNTGSIMAANLAFDVEGDDNTVVNFDAGIIRGAYGDASHQFVIHFEGIGNRFANAGLVTAGYDADGEVAGGNTNSIAVLLDGIGNSVTNFGTIQGAGTGVQGVAFTGGSNDLFNSGTILVEGDESIAVRLSAIATSTVDGPAAAPVIARIENDGRIEAYGDNAIGIAIFSLEGQSNLITNTAEGTIEADGVAVQGGDGSETLVNAGTIIGGDFGLGTAIDLGAGDDTLVIVAGSQIIGTVDGGEGLDRIRLGAASAGDIATFYGDDYINFEHISVESGDWRFAGIGSFGLLTIDEFARLGGNGDLNGDLVINGTLAPGNSIGRLRVTGDVVLTSSSIFAAEVSSFGLSDRLVVDGRITLEGGQLQVQPVAAGTYSVRSEYTLMTATNGIVGAFGSVDVAGAFDAYTRNTGHAFDLVLVRQVDFTTGATTPNAAAVGSHLNAELGPMTGDDLVFMMDGILALGAGDRNIALQELSGDLHASQISLNSQAYGRFMQAVGSRVRNQPGASGVWLETGMRSGEVDASPGAHGLDTEDRSITAGYQHARHNGSIGIALGFNQQETTGGHVEADTDSFGATAYALRQAGAYTFSAHLGWMSHDVGTVRQLDLAFVPAAISAGYRATTLGVSARLARQSTGTVMGGAVFEPELTLNYATTDTEAFSEAGDPAAALDIRARQLDSLNTRLGASLAWGQSQADSQYFMRLHGAWVHEYLDDTATLFGQFQNTSSAFLTEGTAYDSDRFQAGVSFAARVGTNMQVHFDYLGESSQSQTGHSLSARLVASF